jgi:uncharacterized membrane protein YhaH (DUF805 family)
VTHPFFRGLRRLLDFSGRDSRDDFWGYAGPMVGIVLLAAFVAFLPGFTDTMARMARFAAQHPDQATVTAGGGSFSISVKGSHPELMGDIGAEVVRMAAVFGVGAVLLSAAVTRRLHDRGLSGFVGLLPVPFFALSMAHLPRAMAEPAGPDFWLMFGVDLLYLVTLGGLLFLLAGRSRPGPNRWGEQPSERPRPPPPPLTPRRAP